MPTTMNDSNCSRCGHEINTMTDQLIWIDQEPFCNGCGEYKNWINGLRETIEEYFKNVTKEQLRKDLEAADYEYYNKIKTPIFSHLLKTNLKEK